MQAPPTKEGPRINEDIRVPRVLLIDQHGEKQGIMPTSAAIEAAEEAGLDLVEVSPNSDPPVCKILDYGKYKFEEQKKKGAAQAPKAGRNQRDQAAAQHRHSRLRCEGPGHAPLLRGRRQGQGDLAVPRRRNA